jgi:hypothetical protein
MFKSKNTLFKRGAFSIVCYLKSLLIAEELAQYSNHPKCLNEDSILPILRNQKMNGYLKEIRDLCNIPKVITFHMVRRTFATSVTLTNRVPKIG